MTTRNPWSQWIIIILVVLNLALLASFWYSRIKTEPIKKQSPIKKGSQTTSLPPGLDDPQWKRQGGRLARFLERELDYTAAQIKQFMQLRDEHQQKTRQLRRQMDELRRDMMDQLVEENPDTEKAHTLSQEMGAKFAALEKATFDHMLGLMKIGDMQQRSKYKRLIGEILEQMRPPRHGAGPGPDRPGRPGGANRPDRIDRPDHGQGPEGPGRMQGQGQHLLDRLQRELNLTSDQLEKIRLIVTGTFQQLKAIPNDPQYRDHHLRKKAAGQLHRVMSEKLRALLTDAQKRQYDPLENTLLPPPPRR